MENLKINEAFVRFLANMEVIGRDDYYIRNLSTYILSVCRACDWVYLSDISAKSFLRWRDLANKSSKTLNNYLNGWRSFIGWLFDREYIEVNPFDRVKPLRVYGKVRPRRALSLAEIQRLLSVAPEYRRLAYLFAFYTGCRRNEIFSLTWDLLSFGEKDYITILSGFNKNRKKQVLPLYKPLGDLLLSLRPVKFFKVPVFTRFSTKYDRIDFHNAGICRLTPDNVVCDFHSLRKSFCTYLVIGGCSPRVTQELMRHSDYKLTSEIYTDVKLLDLDSGFDSLPDLDTVLSGCDNQA